MRSYANTDPENRRAVLTLELRDDELTPFIEGAIRRLRSQVRIPGFRKGHVPTPVLRARLGEEALRREAVEEAVDELYERALVDNGLDVVGQPQMRIVEGQEAGDVKVEIDLEMRPMVTVEGIGAIEVEVPRVGVAEEDIDQVLDSLRAQRAKVIDVDRPARSGDQVTLNVLEVGPDGSETVATPYLSGRLGSGELPAEWEGPLEGATAGTKVDIEVRATTEAAAGAAAEGGDASEGSAAAEASEGSTRRVRLEVLAVRELELPPLDDAFATEVSEFETLDALREDIRATLRERRQRLARDRFEQVVRQRVLELVEPKEIPESLLTPAYRQEITAFGQALDGTGLSLRRYLEMSAQDEQALAGRLTQRAAEAVLWDLALRAIAHAEAISVEPAEIEAEIDRLISVGALPRREEVSPLQEWQVRAALAKQHAYRRLLNVVAVHDTDGSPVTLEQLGLGELVEGDRGDAEGEPLETPVEEPS
jgi:trigger factor